MSDDIVPNLNVHELKFEVYRRLDETFLPELSIINSRYLANILVKKYLSCNAAPRELLEEICEQWLQERRAAMYLEAKKPKPVYPELRRWVTVHLLRLAGALTPDAHIREIALGVSRQQSNV